MNDVLELITELKKYEPGIVKTIYNYVILMSFIKYVSTTINSDIKKIRDGYKIIHTEEDGCDEYGTMYWVDCINGWYGRSWNLNEAKYNEIYNYINKCKIYYINKILLEFSLYDKYNFLRWYFNIKNTSLIVNVYTTRELYLKESKNKNKNIILMITNIPYTLI